jgi:hypothetical protein
MTDFTTFLRETVIGISKVQENIVQERPFKDIEIG